MKTFEEKVENKEVMYLVLELVSGGELYKDITGRKTYTEADASHAIKQILKAIEFCHSKKIVHSDLKPQNILLKSKKEEAPIKIVDFGLAFEVIGDKLAWHGGGGTVTHLPPEVVNKQPYGKPIDIWACGVICKHKIPYAFGITICYFHSVHFAGWKSPISAYGRIAIEGINQKSDLYCRQILLHISTFDYTNFQPIL